MMKYGTRDDLFIHVLFTTFDKARVISAQLKFQFRLFLKENEIFGVSMVQ